MGERSMTRNQRWLLIMALLLIVVLMMGTGFIWLKVSSGG